MHVVFPYSQFPKFRIIWMLYTIAQLEYLEFLFDMSLQGPRLATMFWIVDWANIGRLAICFNELRDHYTFSLQEHWSACQKQHSICNWFTWPGGIWKAFQIPVHHGNLGWGKFFLIPFFLFDNSSFIGCLVYEWRSQKLSVGFTMSRIRILSHLWLLKLTWSAFWDHWGWMVTTTAYFSSDANCNFLM